jgi:hypothetical protein
VRYLTLFFCLFFTSIFIWLDVPETAGSVTKED